MKMLIRLQFILTSIGINMEVKYVQIQHGEVNDN